MRHKARTTTNNAHIHVVGLALQCARIEVAIFVGEAL